ncbi:MAG: hypothetical protein ACYTDT_12775, partial [Planctomycetota bacterium]
MRVFIPLILAVLCLFLLGENARVSAVEDKPYKNTEHGFRINKAEGWIFSQPTPKGGIKYTAKFTHKVKDLETSVAVMLFEATDAIDTPNKARTAIKASWEKNAAVSGITSGQAKYAGKNAPWLRGNYSKGEDHILHQYFLLNEGNIFILQTVAPKDGYKKSDKTLQKLLV